MCWITDNISTSTLILKKKQNNRRRALSCRYFTKKVHRQLCMQDMQICNKESSHNHDHVCFLRNFSSAMTWYQMINCVDLSMSARHACVSSSAKGFKVNVNFYQLTLVISKVLRSLYVWVCLSKVRYSKSEGSWLMCLYCSHQAQASHSRQPLIFPFCITSLSIFLLFFFIYTQGLFVAPLLPRGHRPN